MNKYELAKQRCMYLPTRGEGRKVGGWLGDLILSLDSQSFKIGGWVAKIRFACILQLFLWGMSEEMPRL